MSQTILVTGASSGIGEALALYYARQGARLGLIGRNRARLDGVAEACRAAGAADVQIGAIDVRANDELAAWIANFDRRSPIDLAIAGAGLAGGAASPGQPETAGASREIFAVNVLGTVNTVQAVLPAMLLRGSGQILLVSSLAGIIRLPDLPSYSASKAAILNYGLSLRDALRRRGVSVSIACPGYVDTAMGRQLNGRKTFVITPEQAARAIAAGLVRRKRVIAFPLVLAWATRLAAHLPAWAVRLVTPSFRVTPLRIDR
jgi:short-subunit dehydrogenase